MELIRDAKNLEETKQIALEFFDCLLKNQKTEKARVVFLSGELGAGKTEFVRALSQFLLVKDRIQSPTFVIMRNLKTQHEIFKNLTHIDAYRLTKKEELETLGFKDLTNDSNRLLLIEWPENVPNLVSPDAEIKIEIISENERKFKIKFTPFTPFTL